MAQPIIIVRENGFVVEVSFVREAEDETHDSKEVHFEQKYEDGQRKWVLRWPDVKVDFQRGWDTDDRPDERRFELRGRPGPHQAGEESAEAC